MGHFDEFKVASTKGSKDAPRCPQCGKTDQVVAYDIKYSKLRKPQRQWNCDRCGGDWIR